jgi:hypothetical protein
MELIEILKKAGIAADKVDALAAEIQAGIDDEVVGLRTKNKELLGENRKLKAAGNDPGKLEEEIETLKGQIDDLTKANGKLERDLKKTAADKEALGADLTGKLTGMTGRLHGLVLEDALTKALTEAGVTDPVNLKLARLSLKGANALAIQDDESGLKAVAKIVKDGKESVADVASFVKDWSLTDEGKRLISAKNTGSGASGGTGAGSGGDPMARFKELNAKAELTDSEAREMMNLANQVGKSS